MGILQVLFGKKKHADPEKRVKVHHGKKIYIAADHAGFEMKEKLKLWLDHHRIVYEDLGNKILDSKDDYPDFAEKLAKRVAKEKTQGILACGSGIGMCIAANKIKGARAADPISFKEARLAREHNDANVLCLSGWFNSYHYSTKLMAIFLTTKFSHEPRHVRRLEKIKKIENGN
ncbi:MAG: RpiB/LacA/LacB family sugar-phosphate isomerase [Candidatus Woesearchaeota archaeon]